MKKHWKYLQYVLRHKWYVFLECAKFGLYWQGITHDWSKFLLSEWIPYANYFYGDSETKKHGYYNPSTSTYEFNLAWLKHQHRNPHHWQYWMLKMDEEEDDILTMLDKYRKEMLCDWIGASRAQGFGNDIIDWYMKHEKDIHLHPETREWVEYQLGFLP